MICRVLPNRLIVLVMTPREASMLENQILEPQDFPWQDSEAQFVALGAKAHLHTAVEKMGSNELDASVGAILTIAQEEAAKEAEPEEDPEQPPEQPSIQQMRKESDGPKRLRRFPVLRRGVVEDPLEAS